MIQSSHESSRNDFATFLRILIKKKEYGSLPLIVKKERKNKKYIFMNSILQCFFFVAEFQFDAFIIYSTRDEDWIKKTLLPTLEDKHGLKCCVHYRDFIAGLPFRNNMVDSVYKSRKTVAVVSQSFFDSKYCPHELDFALHRLLEKRDNSLVVIKLDDVDKNKLPKALQKRSYIDYPHLKEKQAWKRNLVKCFEVRGENV